MYIYIYIHMYINICYICIYIYCKYHHCIYMTLRSDNLYYIYIYIYVYIYICIYIYKYFIYIYIYIYTYIISAFTSLCPIKSPGRRRPKRANDVSEFSSLDFPVSSSSLFLLLLGSLFILTIKGNVALT
jgi:hypothetical protein